MLARRIRFANTLGIGAHFSRLGLGWAPSALAVSLAISLRALTVWRIGVRHTLAAVSVAREAAAPGGLPWAPRAVSGRARLWCPVRGLTCLIPMAAGAFVVTDARTPLARAVGRYDRDQTTEDEDTLHCFGVWGRLED